MTRLEITIRKERKETESEEELLTGQEVITDMIDIPQEETALLEQGISSSQPNRRACQGVGSGKLQLVRQKCCQKNSPTRTA